MIFGCFGFWSNFGREHFIIISFYISIITLLLYFKLSNNALAFQKSCTGKAQCPTGNSSFKAVIEDEGSPDDSSEWEANSNDSEDDVDESS